ncbi:putative zinc knuckle [Colletotrichum sublineola]|uniref:Putative zinc knuckle n=1 Tax=Colletotrichum sublineola TaxID=1173701 RepID=A0A066X027_COLSU|nr:putative zinc knuckle [Colletotrichum sublineola]
MRNEPFLGRITACMLTMGFQPTPVGTVAIHGEAGFAVLRGLLLDVHLECAFRTTIRNGPEPNPNKLFLPQNPPSPYSYKRLTRPLSLQFSFNGEPHDGPGTPTWMYAKDARQQVAGAPAPRGFGQRGYPSYFGNKATPPEKPLPLQAAKPVQHVPLVPGQSTPCAPGTKPGAWRAFYNDKNRAEFDVGYYDSKKGSLIVGCGEGGEGYPGMATLVAALTLATECVELLIHNIYDPNNQPDHEVLLIPPTINPKSILLGDFNLHHKRSGGVKVKSDDAGAKNLLQKTDAACMTCVVPPGLVTYRNGSHSSSTSTIDLVFAGSHLKGDRFVKCEIAPVRLFEHSDHHVVKSVFKVGPRRDMSTHAPPLGQVKSDVDDYVEKILRALRAAIKEHVPSVRRRPHRRAFKLPTSSDMKKSSEAEQRALRALRVFQGRRRRGHRNSKLRKRCSKAFRATSHYIRKEKNRMWRERVASRARIGYHSFYMAEQSLRWCGSRETAHMPRLRKPDGSLCHDDAESAVCLMQSIWSDISTGAPPDPVRLPPLPQDRVEHSTSPVFGAFEVKGVCKRLSRGKAYGPDGVSSDAIKMARAPLAPYLANLANACVRLSYHPDVFKLCNTVALKKKDKADYSNPRAWRPVALLSCLGKVIERLIAQRLQYLAMEHDLLPGTQFGTNRRCTTKALEYLLTPVYKSFIYPAEKGIPSCLILYIRSFLSARKTRLHLPGYVSDEVWVNVGIPQGSPLSPILSVFFTAPMLEKFKKENPNAEIVIAMSHVDDSYILVTSPSHKTNCDILARWHGEIMAWATPNGIRFDPSKY